MGNKKRGGLGNAGFVAHANVRTKERHRKKKSSPLLPEKFDLNLANLEDGYEETCESPATILKLRDDLLRRKSVSRLESFFRNIVSVTLPGESRVPASRLSTLLKAKEAWQVPYVKGQEVDPFPESGSLPRRFLLSYRDEADARKMFLQLWGATVEGFSVWPALIPPNDLLLTPDQFDFDDDRLLAFHLPGKCDYANMQLSWPNLVSLTDGPLPGTSVLRFPSPEAANQVFDSSEKLRVRGTPVCLIFNFSLKPRC